MKIVYFGDRHNRISPPENRLDDFHHSMKMKDEEILEIAKKANAELLLQPGDFWDEPSPQLDFAFSRIKRWFGVDFQDLIKEVFNVLKNGDIESIDKLKSSMGEYIPMAGVVGNHEVFGNNINTLDKTMIGFMEKLGLIKLLSKEKALIFEIEDGFTLAITGSNYHLEGDTNKKDQYVVDEKLGDIHIHVAHGMLSDKSLGKMIKHTTLDEISHTKADLTITGDDHIGFPLTEIDGKYFVNTGSIPRLTVDEKEIKRQPKILIIDVTKENGLKLEERYLKSAQKGTIVLDETKSKSKKRKDRKKDELRDIAKKANLREARSMAEIVNALSESKNIEPHIKKPLLEALAKKEEKIDKSVVHIQENVYISEVILENFLSHEYSRIPLSKGLNVFCGESRRGKTTVMRAIDWIIRNKLSRKKMIRRGADYCKATIKLSNGFIISRISERKSSGENGYIIFDPNTGKEEHYNTTINDYVKELVGYSEFTIDEDSSLDLNFYSQGEGWFLLNESDKFKAKVIGAVYGTHYADAVYRDNKNQINKNNRKIKKETKEIIEIEEALKEYENLDKVKLAIEKYEKLIKELQVTEEKKDKIEEILKNKKELNEKHQRALKILDRTKNIDTVENMFYQLKEKHKQKESIENALKEYVKLKKYIRYTKKVLYKTQSIEDAKESLNAYKKIIDDVDAIDTHYKEHSKLELKLKDIRQVLVKTKDIGLVEKKYNELSQIYDKGLKLKDVLTNKKKYMKILSPLKEKIKRLEAIDESKYKELLETIKLKEDIATIIDDKEQFNKEILKTKTTIKSAEETIENLIADYQVVLKKQGKCPTCFHTIDKETVDKILVELG